MYQELCWTPSTTANITNSSAPLTARWQTGRSKWPRQRDKAMVLGKRGVGAWGSQKASPLGLEKDGGRLLSGKKPSAQAEEKRPEMEALAY